MTRYAKLALLFGKGSGIGSVFSLVEPKDLSAKEDMLGLSYVGLLELQFMESIICLFVQHVKCTGVGTI